MPGTHNRLHSDGGAQAIWVTFCAFLGVFSLENALYVEIPRAREAQCYVPEPQVYSKSWL